MFKIIGLGLLSLSISAKGFDLYFSYFLKQVNFTDQDWGLIRSLLPYMWDCSVQAGMNGLATTDNHNAFMLGGSDSDALVGGTAANSMNYVNFFEGKAA